VPVIGNPLPVSFMERHFLLLRISLFGCVVLLGASMCAFAQEKSSGSAKKSVGKATSSSVAGKSKKHASSRRTKRSRKSASWRRGQQKMDSARAREIQEALLREGYLEGKATGVWDQSSQRAMERFQADNGWQTKTVPDSRALIKLGLGPNHDHLLNPESAMTSPIEPSNTTAHTAPGTPSADSTSTSGQPQN
jgi:peptidoglycan hydrolase-like protein with peptidoglycan-binding domain